MARRISQFDWRLFRFAITQRSLYVLGAGASLPIIPSGLTAHIRKAFCDQGGFPAAVEPPSELKKRILTYDLMFDIEAELTGTISQNVIDAHTPNEVVEALLARELVRPSARLPPQYEIFNFLSTSIILNFNNDNLADGIDRRRHWLLRPHGFIDHAFVHSDAVTKALAWSAIPGDFAQYLNYHRPLPEPTDMTSRYAFRFLERYFEFTKCVALIGYSFGERRDTGRIDDSETFEMLVSLLRWRPKPVLVIGPDPERICARLEQAIRRATVSRLHCKWNVLAEFMLTDGFGTACEQQHKTGPQGITSAYFRFEEALESRLEHLAEVAEAGVIVRLWPLSFRTSWPPL